MPKYFYADGTVSEKKLNKKFHRVDGPAVIDEFDIGFELECQTFMGMTLQQLQTVRTFDENLFMNQINETINEYMNTAIHSKEILSREIITRVKKVIAEQKAANTFRAISA